MWGDAVLITIARPINLDDSVIPTPLTTLNRGIKQGVLVPKVSPTGLLCVTGMVRNDRGEGKIGPRGSPWSISVARPRREHSQGTP